MLYANFDWDCPICKKTNWNSEVDDERLYTCKGCKNEFHLTFSVQVFEVEQYDKEKEAAELEASHWIDVEVSRDEGKTWEKMKIDRRNVDPDKSPLKIGEWLRTAANELFEVTLSPNNRLGTKRIGSSAAS